MTLTIKELKDIIQAKNEANDRLIAIAPALAQTLIEATTREADLLKALEQISGDRKREITTTKPGVRPQPSSHSDILEAMRLIAQSAIAAHRASIEKGKAAK